MPLQKRAVTLTYAAAPLMATSTSRNDARIDAGLC
jgi:hypothetical protein